MKIIPLSEGAFTVDRTKQFVPFDLQKDNITERPVGSLLVEIQPFVIITSKDIVLLDTGLGFKNSEGILQIHTNLLDHGIDPSEITKVLLSHLHKDHAGGITKKEKGHPGLLSFTKAEYYINKQELEFAFEKGAPTYETSELVELKDSSQLKFTEGNGLIDNYIRYETTGAHCPYHQVFWIIEENKKIFFGGDVAPQLQQMKTKFVAKYDFDGKKSMELRKQWWHIGKEEKWTFLFYHDIKCPIYEY